MSVLTYSMAQMLIEEQGENIVIPDTYTSIDAYSFSGKEISSIFIPDSVTSIGDGAFYGNNLTSLDLPESVVSIGSGAFNYNQLTSIEIPDSVTSIGAYAFSENQLTSVEISDNITSIEESAFSFNQLKRVAIPDGVTSIGFMAFEGNKLTKIKIPAGVTEIGHYSFYGNKLKSVKIPESVNSIGEDAFQKNQIKSVKIPSSVNSIGKGAFSKNQIKSVEIADGVVSIGGDAFEYNKLQSVEIPASVLLIGEDAFAHNKLKSVEIPASVVSIGKDAFSENSSLATVSISKHGNFDLSVLPEDVEVIFRDEKVANAFKVDYTHIDLSEAITSSGKKNTKIQGSKSKDLITDGLGKCKMVGGDGADQFYFSGEENFKKNKADTITDFDASEGDSIIIAEKVFDEVFADKREDHDRTLTLCIAKNKKDLKRLSKVGYNLVYFQQKGELYIDGNGKSKGFGKLTEGGLIANLGGNAVINSDNILIGSNHYHHDYDDEYGDYHDNDYLNAYEY